PPDEVLKESLLKYVAQTLSQDKKRARLVADHGLSLSIASLNRLKRRLQIPSAKRGQLPRDVVEQAIIDKCEKDLAQSNGPEYIKTQLRQKMIVVPRDTIREVMHREVPLGAALRYPGRRKSTTPRTPLSSLGPFHEISSDGHEKLGAQALQMGGIGLSLQLF
ncbi:hypothetical protein FB45DRAFT_677374, partial [Roridomyces roridus]